MVPFIWRVIIPKLLELMGLSCESYTVNQKHFPHNPEPLKEHLTDISELVVKKRNSSRYSSRSDVDRLAFICEDGEMFGEEYTLVACADYVLTKLRKHSLKYVFFTCFT
jgi:phosphomannomutase